jgi:nucleoid-associated protein YgaU
MSVEGRVIDVGDAEREPPLHGLDRGTRGDADNQHLSPAWVATGDERDQHAKRGQQGEAATDLQQAGQRDIRCARCSPVRGVRGSTLTCADSARRASSLTCRRPRRIVGAVRASARTVLRGTGRP